ncbi:MAG TPA: peptidoglycan-associated lipoprotein Pal [Burkholderiales bacterium]|nr:peptidoglycan-associated lipoprotein Pal [Burkholderiales bacterium]
MKRLLVIGMAALLAAGCASKEEKPAAAVEERTPAPVQPPPAPVAPAPEAKPLVTPQVQVNPLKDPNNILSKRSIYFDYDSYIVKDEFKPLVTAHSKYLTDNRSARVTIQGNTDERGSSEYNLALGQRRADAVKKMMQLLGVTDSQIEAVSFGKEKPKAQGKDEAAYAENRRDDIVYQGE